LICASSLLPQALLDGGATVVGKNVMDEMVSRPIV